MYSFDRSMTTVPTHPDQTKPTLRRATYVHVSDLTSAYNIDHARLEQELSRVRAERDEESFPRKDSLLAETESDPSGVSSELDVSISQSPQKKLQPPRGGYNLCVLVGKVNVVVDKRRVDRSRVRLAEVEIGDETGTVSLRARDEQIDILEEVSERSGAVVLRNCTLELYQGKHIRLAVTKWGKLCVYPDNVASTPPPPSKMNMDRNFSLIDLSLVASEMAALEPEGIHNSRQNKALPENIVTGRGQPSKSGGNHPKQQIHSSSRRSRRGKSGGGNQSHYGGSQGDTGSKSSQSNQRRYQSLHNFNRYEQGVDMRQFPYQHPGQHDVMSPTSAQQLMLQHQYELQQRQFQQMYAHRPSERHASSMGQVQAPGMVLPSGNFDYSRVASDQHPPTMPMVGQPIIGSATLMVGNMPGQEGIQMQGGTTIQTASSPVPLSHVISPDDFSHGRMNPEATVFAPAYINTQGAPPPTALPAYFPTYNPSQTGSTGNFSAPSALDFHKKDDSSNQPPPHTGEK